MVYSALVERIDYNQIFKFRLGWKEIIIGLRLKYVHAAGQSYDKCVDADDLYQRGMLMDLINSTSALYLR